MSHLSHLFYCSLFRGDTTLIKSQQNRLVPVMHSVETLSSASTTMILISTGVDVRLVAPSTTFGTLALQKLLRTRNDHTLRGVISFQDSHAYKSQCESAMNSVLANGVWVGGHMLKVFVAL